MVVILIFVAAVTTTESSKSQCLRTTKFLPYIIFDSCKPAAVPLFHMLPATGGASFLRHVIFVAKEKRQCFFKFSAWWWWTSCLLMYHWPKYRQGEAQCQWNGNVCSSHGEGGIKNYESNAIYHPCLNFRMQEYFNRIPKGKIINVKVRWVWFYENIKPLFSQEKDKVAKQTAS